MPTNAINDTGVKYLYDKLHGEIAPVAEAVSTDESMVEGNPINFSTLSAQTAQSTIIDLEPIQDLHGYDKPWVGGAGRNLVNNADVSRNSPGITFSYTDTSITIDGDGTGAWQGVKIDKEIVTYSAGTYYMKFKVTSAANFDSFLVGLRKISDNVFTNATICPTNVREYSGVFTISEDCYFSIIINGSGGNQVANSVVVENLIISTTDVPFEPYENICPITGRTEIGILGCGKNLANPNSICNLYPNPTYNVIFENANTRSFILKCNSGDNYTVSKKAGQRFRIGFTNAFPTVNEPFTGYSENDTATSISVIVPQNVNYMIVYVWSSSADTDTAETMLASVQIEKNNQATNYEPYTKSNNLTISLGQTVYGGTLDVENGVLVVDRIARTINDAIFSNWRVHQTYNTIYNVDAQTVDKASGLTNIISSAYATTNVATLSEMKNGDIRGHLIYNSIYIRDDNYVNDVNSFLSDRGNEQVCYELATPITINLTPHTIKLLEGVNNISTDGDKITLTYRDGSVATLGDLTSAVDNLDSKIDDSQILTDTVTGDKYKLVVTSGVLSIEQISN